MVTSPLNHFAGVGDTVLSGYFLFAFLVDIRVTGASLVAQRLRVCLQCRGCRFDPCHGKIPWKRKWQPTPVFLPEKKSHGQNSLVGYSPWGRKEVDMT